MKLEKREGFGGICEETVKREREVHEREKEVHEREKCKSPLKGPALEMEKKIPSAIIFCYCVSRIGIQLTSIALHEHFFERNTLILNLSKILDYDRILL